MAGGKLEATLPRGASYWISNLIVDALGPTVTVDLVVDADRNNHCLRIVFRETKLVQCDWHGEPEDLDDNCLGTLLGIDESDLGKGTEYIIATDVSEVRFQTDRVPEVNQVS